MNFENSFKMVLEFEGAESNDPRDRGGHTKFGISKRAYPNLNISEITLEQAKIIHFNDYWLKLNCDELPHDLNTLVYNIGFMSGTTFAGKRLQEALRRYDKSIVRDGIIGPVTVRTVLKFSQKYGLPELSSMFLASTAKASTNFKTFNYHGFGWFKRYFKTAIACKSKF